jgi:alpha-L-fucosidase
MATQSTTPRPRPSPFRWGRCTKKVDASDASTTLYLHVFTWPQDGKLAVPGLKNSIEAAYLLTDADHKPLKTAGIEGGGLTIDMPSEAPSPISSTVVLKVSGPLDINQPAEAPPEATKTKAKNAKNK